MLVSVPQPRSDPPGERVRGQVRLRRGAVRRIYLGSQVMSGGGGECSGGGEWGGGGGGGGEWGDGDHCSEQVVVSMVMGQWWSW